MVLAIAVSSGWSLRQIDINNAFLQGTLQEDVYMEQPPGFINKHTPDYVCKLRKAIYGLKQAPQAWPQVLVYLLVYVDDIIDRGNNTRFLEEVITRLSSRFSLKDLGQLFYFLGVEV